jgi:plasmid stabilization system protein ParE
MVHSLAPQARAELSSIWAYIVKESGNVAAADGVIDAITERFCLLAQYPRMAVPVTICAPACAALRSGNT